MRTTISRLLRRGYSTATKQFYVTTPIFYVNAAPHIGHLHSMVLADCFKRWNDFKTGQEGFLVTGTDEHGLKVQQAAHSAGKQPREYVDLASQSFQELAQVAGIEYSRFIRTTDSDNIAAAQHLWQRLKANGYIYKGEHNGWYCISDEAFYPENQVHKTDDGVMVSKESGKPVEWTSETNYFFSLSKLRQPLLEHLRANQAWIEPEVKWQDVEREVDYGLEDLSISRPESRNSWGVPVPDDPSQVMYVWFDALANYLAAAGFPENVRFPPDVQVLGKDIVRFHAVYWPAFLLAAGLPLPKKLLVHAHWTMGGSKMSKSTGNVIDPVYTIKACGGADSVKFYLLNDGYLDHDTVYGADRVVARHNTELVNKYGNLVMRVCGDKFSIEDSLRQVHVADELASISPELVPRYECIMHDTDTLVERADAAMAQGQTPRALGEVWNLISLANRFMQDAAPWACDTVSQTNAVIRVTAQVARVVSIVLQPFIPVIAKKSLDRLNVSPVKRAREFAHFNADTEFGQGANYKGNPPVRVLKP